MSKGSCTGRLQQPARPAGPAEGCETLQQQPAACLPVPVKGKLQQPATGPVIGWSGPCVLRTWLQGQAAGGKDQQQQPTTGPFHPILS